MSIGLQPKVVKATLEGVMPWLPPTGKVTVEALAKLDRPLIAWATESWFDSAAYYARFADEPRVLSRLEEKVAPLAPRREWRMERVWSPDDESDDDHDAAYEKASVDIGGHRLHPRDLDAYTTLAWNYADLSGDDDFLDAEAGTGGLTEVPGDLTTALAWAAAGVCVLQQSLPYPFGDILLHGDNDNRPAHRIVYAYASLLRVKHPRKAAPWFTALVYLNPMDNFGARFLAPGGPTYPNLG